jgi:hypothetical protein
MADEPPLHPPAAVATTLLPAVPPMEPDGGTPQPSFPRAPVAASPAQPAHTPAAATLHSLISWRYNIAPALMIAAVLASTGHPKLRQCIIDPSGMGKAVLGSSLLWNIAANLHRRCDFHMDGWFVRPSQAWCGSFAQNNLHCLLINTTKLSF